MKLEEIFQIVLKEEEELERIHMSDMAAHFQQRIDDIKKGLKITESERYTELLKKQLKQWNDLIQDRRTKGDVSTTFKRLEKEWWDLLEIFRDYDIATFIHNRNYPKNKIHKIQERIGFILTPSVNTEE